MIEHERHVEINLHKTQKDTTLFANLFPLSYLCNCNRFITIMIKKGKRCDSATVPQL